MIPVTTAVAPAIPVPRLGSRSREPTCRPNLAAVAVVTATWKAPAGRPPRHRRAGIRDQPGAAAQPAAVQQLQLGGPHGLVGRLPGHGELA